MKKKLMFLRDLQIASEEALFDSSPKDQAALLSAMASRFLFMLWSRRAKLGPFASVTLQIEYGQSAGISSTHIIFGSVLEVKYSLPRKAFFESPDRRAAVVKLVASVLFELARVNQADCSVVNFAQTQLLLYGDAVRMSYLIERLGAFEIEIYLTAIEALPDFYQVYLKLHDTASDRTAHRLLAEVEFTEFYSLIGKIKIAENILTIMPRPGRGAEHLVKGYKERGFTAPISVHIDTLVSNSDIA